METKQENILEGICGKNLTWFFSKGDGILTIEGSGEMNSYDKEPAPWDGYEFKKVVISQGVLNICPSAFEDCENLTSIEIPDTVTSIGDAAFIGCKGLTTIKIPNSITSIGNSAFEDCDNLKSIEIPSSVMSIGERAFAWCGLLTAFDVAKDNPNYCSEKGVLFNKDKTTLIQYPACRYDKRYYIPNSVTSISIRAFNNCWKLKNIIIPDSVKSIGEYAFHACNALVSITSKSIVPPQLLYGDAFDEVDKSISVFVPKESVEAYKKADGWGEFRNISDIPFYGKTESISEEIACWYNKHREDRLYKPFLILDDINRVRASVNYLADELTNVMKIETVVLETTASNLLMGIENYDNRDDYRELDILLSEIIMRTIIYKQVDSTQLGILLITNLESCENDFGKELTQRDYNVIYSLARANESNHLRKVLGNWIVIFTGKPFDKCNTTERECLETINSDLGYHVHRIG